MNHDAIIQIVQKGDPDRFLATMAAPQNMRLDLFTLYALNVEVSRAPWASHEEMICEMRLQFWLDMVEAIDAGHTGRQHELVAPLCQVIKAHNLPMPLFEQLITARRWDVYKDPFKGVADFERYIDHTSGNLMWLAALAVGADAKSEKAVRNFAYGVGVANWLIAVPELLARGRMPLLDADTTALAQRALLRMSQADKSLLRPAAPALRTGWMASGVLKRAIRAENQLAPSEFSRRGRLLIKAMTGRW